MRGAATALYALSSPFVAPQGPFGWWKLRNLDGGLWRATLRNSAVREDGEEHVVCHWADARAAILNRSHPESDEPGSESEPESDESEVPSSSDESDQLDESEELG